MSIPRLHPDSIEEIKQRADIYEVVSEYVVLRRRGKDFVGLCPFHAEKTPSFTVSTSKQMYYCFGCQAGGNVIKFLMDLHKRSFAEVVLDLAGRYQIPVQTLDAEHRQQLQRQLLERSQLYEILTAACQFYRHTLRQSQGRAAFEYLRYQRHLKDETIEQFGLGYAPAGWETLYRYLVEDKRYPVQLVEKAGLIKPRKEGGYYDVFRDRLMIPIRDAIGRTIAFGGRSLADEQPKYLNSPETELFHKGKTLFALERAKTAISQLDQAVVVEGYFDAIALHAAGITNVVASLGTALSKEQVRLLLRYSDSKQLILNFDADQAGTNAIERAIAEIADLAYKGEVQLKILTLPDGKDADEYLRGRDPEDYRQLVANAPGWLDWQIEQILQNRDLKKSSDFQQVSRDFVKLLKKIGNNDTLNYYVSRCAEILTLGDGRLLPLRVEGLLSQIAPQKSSYSSRPVQIPRLQRHKSKQELSIQESVNTAVEQQNSLLEQAEALLLRIYLYCPEQRQVILQALEQRDLQFSFSHHRFLWRQILEISSAWSLQQDLIAALQDRCLQFPEESELVSHLFHLNEKSQKEILRASQVVQAAIACMERVLREKRYRYFLELWQQTDPKAEPERWQSYYQAFYAEKQRLQELDRQRLFSLTELLSATHEI
jgi:DNA primase